MGQKELTPDQSIHSALPKQDLLVYWRGQDLLVAHDGVRIESKRTALREKRGRRPGFRHGRLNARPRPLSLEKREKEPGFRLGLLNARPRPLTLGLGW